MPIVALFVMTIAVSIMVFSALFMGIVAIVKLKDFAKKKSPIIVKCTFTKGD